MKRYIYWILGLVIAIGIIFTLYIFIPRSLAFDISVPQNPKFDYSNSENYIIVSNDDGLQITISNEYHLMKIFFGMLNITKIASM